MTTEKIPEESAAPQPPLVPAWKVAATFLKERWLTVDTRTLGFFRICFGLLLLSNLWDRAGGFDLVSFYSNDGIMPNHYALFLPVTRGFWSLIAGFSTPGEVTVVMWIIAGIYLLYTVGYRTRLMQVLAMLAYMSVNFRFLLIQHGGNVVMNIILVWTLFLPLGERVSVDALLKSLRGFKEKSAESLNARGWAVSPSKHVALAFWCICFNFAVIYFFNALHKGGPGWLDGSGVHYVLWQNRMATQFAGFLRMHEPFWLSPLMTWGTLVVERALPLLILTPVFQRRLRPLATLNIWLLHGGIASLSTLGPFSFSMMMFSLLLLQPEGWEWLKRFVKLRFKPRTVVFDPANPAQVLAARVLSRLDPARVLTFQEGPVWSAPFGSQLILWTARLLSGWEDPTPHTFPERPVTQRVWRWTSTLATVVILIAVCSQILMENWSIPKAIKPQSRPEFLTDIIEYLQIPQGWSMFAPDVPRDDERLIVDAVLVDGSHIDPLTGLPPDMSDEAFDKGPFFMNQHWCELHARMPNWRHHWRNFKDYLMRIPRLKKWGPEKQIVSLEVWVIRARCPVPGQTKYTDFKREKLFDQSI